MKPGKLKVLKFSNGDTVQLKNEQHRIGSMKVLGYEMGTEYPHPLVNVEIRNRHKCYLESVLELVPPESSHNQKGE